MLILYKTNIFFFRVNTRHSFHSCPRLFVEHDQQQKKKKTAPLYFTLRNSARRSRIFNDSHFSQCDASTTHFECDIMCVINSHMYDSDWLKIWSKAKKKFEKKMATEKDESNATHRRIWRIFEHYIVRHFYVCDRRPEPAQKKTEKREKERKTTTLFPLFRQTLTSWTEALRRETQTRAFNNRQFSKRLNIYEKATKNNIPRIFPFYCAFALSVFS